MLTIQYNTPIHLSIHLSIYSSINVSISLSIYQRSIYPSINHGQASFFFKCTIHSMLTIQYSTPIYLSINLLIYLSIYLANNLSMNLFIIQSILGLNLYNVDFFNGHNKPNICNKKYPYFSNRNLVECTKTFFKVVQDLLYLKVRFS